MKNVTGFPPASEVQPTLGIKRLPKHVGLIPDGNRRWAKERGLHSRAGYEAGVVQGLRMLSECQHLGIEEVSVYGFTHENTHRPSDQKEAFTAACVRFAQCALEFDIALLVVGDTRSPSFPSEMRPFAKQRQGDGRLKVNMLVNYGWEWDVRQAILRGATCEGKAVPLQGLLGSREVSRIDLVVRWGGCRRLSGFLPIQSVYADFYVVEAYWPDYEPGQFHDALRWYSAQDVTLGG
jgi:undecaprenyl diphosphate synthase